MFNTSFGNFIMKKIIPFVFYLFTFHFSPFAQDATQRVSPAWQVKKYDLTTTITDRVLNANATLNLQNVGTGAGTRLTLRINELAEVLAVKLNGATATFSKGQSEPLSGGRNLQRIVVNLPSIQPNADFTLIVDYKLKLAENTGLNTISPLGSQFLPFSFWYPTPNSHYAPKGADFAP